MALGIVQNQFLFQYLIKKIITSLLQWLCVEEDDRDINHHGSSLKATDLAPPEVTPVTSIKVVPVQSAFGSRNGSGVRRANGSGFRRSSLIDRNETGEIMARKSFYDNDVVVRRERNLAIARRVARHGVPSVFIVFTVFYVIVAINFYME